MFLLLRKIFSSVLLRISWKVILAIFIGLFFTSWGAMYYFEGNVEFVQPAVYWWFWIVTCTTVGYGDFSPETLGGRVTASVIMILGIGILAIILGKVAEFFVNLTQKQRKGLLMLDIKNHAVILGYRKGETERLVEEIITDTWRRDQIVLCSSKATENPLNDGVRFVHGDFMQKATLEKACVARARCIIIHGHSDDQTLATGIAVHSLIKNRDPESVCVTAYFQDPEREQYLKTVSEDITFVHSLSVPILAQSITDQGSVAALIQLTSGTSGGTLFTLQIPANKKAYHLKNLDSDFRQVHGAIIIGLQQKGKELELSPSFEVAVKSGDVIHYVAKERIDPQSLET